MSMSFDSADEPGVPRGREATTGSKPDAQTRALQERNAQLGKAFFTLASYASSASDLAHDLSAEVGVEFHPRLVALDALIVRIGALADAASISLGCGSVVGEPEIWVLMRTDYRSMEQAELEE